MNQNALVVLFILLVLVLAWFGRDGTRSNEPTSVRSVVPAGEGIP